jgi:hypothetical protein
MNEWELTPTFVLFVDNLVARSSTAFRLFSSNKSRDDRVPHYEATCINNARGALGLFLLPCFVVVTGAAVVVDPVTTASSVSFWIDPDGRAGGVRGKKTLWSCCFAAWKCNDSKNGMGSKPVRFY